MLTEEFGESIHIVSVKDDGVTGNFEITVEGTLVHSKKTKGDGFLNTKERQTKVFEEVYKRLAPAEKPNTPLLTQIQVEPKDAPIVETEADKRANSRSLCVSIVTLLISIPALIGA